MLVPRHTDSTCDILSKFIYFTIFDHFMPILAFLCVSLSCCCVYIICTEGPYSHDNLKNSWANHFNFCLDLCSFLLSYLDSEYVLDDFYYKIHRFNMIFLPNFRICKTQIWAYRVDPNGPLTAMNKLFMGNNIICVDLSRNIRLPILCRTIPHYFDNF